MFGDRPPPSPRTTAVGTGRRGAVRFLRIGTDAAPSKPSYPSDPHPRTCPVRGPHARPDQAVGAAVCRQASKRGPVPSGFAPGRIPRPGGRRLAMAAGGGGTCRRHGLPSLQKPSRSGSPAAGEPKRNAVRPEGGIRPATHGPRRRRGSRLSAPCPVGPVPHPVDLPRRGIPSAVSAVPGAGVRSRTCGY